MNQENKNNVSALKALRESVGLTQPELSQRMHCGIRIIGDWENGRRIPRFDNAIALARELNVSLKELAKAINLDASDVPNDCDCPKK